MKRIALTVLVAAAAALALSITSTAQPDTTRIVFVDGQAAIDAHPSGQQANDLQQQARDELGGIRSDIDTLVGKARSGQQLSPDEQERYQLLLTTLQTVEQRYQQQIGEAVQPAIRAVNQVIRDLAEEQGYDIVLDQGVAGVGGTGLVLFARNDLVITEQVIERVQALE